MRRNQVASMLTRRHFTSYARWAATSELVVHCIIHYLASLTHLKGDKNENGRATSPDVVSIKLIAELVTVQSNESAKDTVALPKLNGALQLFKKVCHVGVQV